MSEELRQCTYCGELTDLTVNTNNDDFPLVCWECYTHEIIKCAGCEIDTPKEDTEETGQFTRVCQECISNNIYQKCINCDEYHDENDLQINRLTNNKYCPSCYEDCDVPSDDAKAYRMGIYHPDA